MQELNTVKAYKLTCAAIIIYVMCEGVHDVL